MRDARVISVNVGRAADADWAGRLKRTAIDKRPVRRPVAVRRLGLAGDEQADLVNHGGPDKAVYVYAREDLDRWQARLGRELRDGMFGENLTTAGLDVAGALLGERWRIGTALVEVRGPRIPCGVFRNWMAERGWVKLFADEGRVGAYLRVVDEGELRTGDPVELVYRPSGGITTRQATRAWYGDDDLLDRILATPDHADVWAEVAARRGRPSADAT